MENRNILWFVTGLCCNVYNEMRSYCIYDKLCHYKNCFLNYWTVLKHRIRIKILFAKYSGSSSSKSKKIFWDITQWKTEIYFGLSLGCVVMYTMRCDLIALITSCTSIKSFFLLMDSFETRNMNKDSLR